MSFLRLRKIKLLVKMVLAKSFMKLSFIFQNRIQSTCIIKRFREVASNADKNKNANFFRKNLKNVNLTKPLANKRPYALW